MENEEYLGDGVFIGTTARTSKRPCIVLETRNVDKRPQAIILPADILGTLRDYAERHGLIAAKAKG